jgi:hypothetical protein
MNILVIVEYTGTTELTADRYDSFQRDELYIGVKGVKNNQDQKIEHVDRGTFHHNADENKKPQRGGHNAL